MLSLTAKDAGRWLTTLPTSADLVLSDDEWVAAMLLRFGLVPEKVTDACCGCGERKSTEAHFFHCHNSGPRKTAINERHDMFASKYLQLATVVGLAVRREQRAYDVADAEADASLTRKRVDLKVILPDGDYGLDFTFVNPTAPSNIQKGSHLAVLAAIKSREKAKLSHYRDSPLQIVPVAYDAFGAPGASAAAFWKKMLSASTMPKTWVAYARSALAVCVQRGNARIFKAAVSERCLARLDIL